MDWIDSRRQLSHSSKIPMLPSSTLDVYSRVHGTGVIAVLTLEDSGDAVPVSRALLAGGVDCIELTLRWRAWGVFAQKCQRCL